jgi:hypothetical protein
MLKIIRVADSKSIIENEVIDSNEVLRGKENKHISVNINKSAVIAHQEYWRDKIGNMQISGTISFSIYL